MDWHGGPLDELCNCRFAHMCCFSAVALVLCGLVLLAVW